MKAGSYSVSGYLVLVWLLMSAACTGGSDDHVVELDGVPDVCPPIGIGGGAGWATSCDGGTIVNTETGATHELHCQPATDRAEAQDIIALRTDAVVVFSCLGDTDNTTTMVQSLVAHPGSSPIDMGFPAFDIKAAAYSTAGGGSIVMVSGTCSGLLVFRLDSTDSLTGAMSPVSVISLNGDEFELDGGRDPGEVPPCTELAAVRGLGSSADGSSLALALAGPDDEGLTFDRRADVYYGSINLEAAGSSLTLTGDMNKMADDIDGLFFSIGVAGCTRGPKLLVSDGVNLSVLSADQTGTLKLPPEFDWGSLAVSGDGRSLLVLTGIPFEPGDLYRSDDFDLC